MPLSDLTTPTRRVTMGEIYRLVAAQGRTLTDIHTAVEARPKWADIDRLEKARDDREAIQNQAIKDLEDNNKWQIRTIGGALIAGVLALIMSAAPIVNKL